jgi:four helix bundle protein
MSDEGMRVLHAAQIAVRQLNDLIDRAPRGRLLYIAQLRDSVGGVAGNIAEGLGRRRGSDRSYKFEIARGEAKETLSRLKPNFETGRIRAREYWPIRDLLETITKMLDSLISHG